MSTSSPSPRPPTGLPTADPEKVGFSADRLARIGKGMQKYIDARKMPGAVTLVARHGRIVHFESRGLMDIDAVKPMRTDTIFRIMSMTKPIACVGLMMLYEEGQFMLDEPISHFLPCFRNMSVKTKRGMTEPARREITFKDCMAHTAGFDSLEYSKIVSGSAAGMGQPAAQSAGGAITQPVPPRTVEEAVELLAMRPLNSHPGTKWEYHPGHDVVGVLIERMSGQRLDDFLQQRILDPLKMVDTHFYLPVEKVDRLAAGYAVDKNDWGWFRLIDSPATSRIAVGPRTYFSAGGGLVSTASDYARFAQMLLNGGILEGSRILGRKTIELMTTNQTGDLYIERKGPGYGYGLGFFVRQSLSDAPLVGSIGAYGWGGIYCTSYFADPKEDLFGLMFTQVLNAPQNPDYPMRTDFERLAYQALVGD
jgi:CubicO group peptidase (beta-lactamase class C family)